MSFGLQHDALIGIFDKAGAAHPGGILCGGENILNGQVQSNKPPEPKRKPSEDLVVEWVIDHSHDRKAAKEKTEKKYAEATRLLKQVIERHPKTPWADLAQDELDRGMAVRRDEWHHNPKYDERAKLVPKY